MMGFMIYFVINMRFFKMFKVFLKSGPSLEKWGKMGGNAWPRIPIYILLMTICYSVFRQFKHKSLIEIKFQNQAKF